MKRPSNAFLAGLAVVAALLGQAGLALALTYTVTSPADAGMGTLRWALDQANAHVGTDKIAFALGAQKTITPQSPLPYVTEAVTIDATTQPGWVDAPIVELDGSQAGDADGLRVTGGTAIIRGLVINRFARSGIALTGNSTVHQVTGCFIGTTADGSADAGNGDHGVLVIDGDLATIGGAGKARNVISGNDGYGVVLYGGAVLNSVVNNHIGVNRSGDQPLPNGASGVRAIGNGNYVGTKNLGNLISANDGYGVEIVGKGNQVLDNRIGSLGAGPAVAGNALAGITISGEDNYLAGNVIVGNGENGIALNPNASNTLIEGNQIGNVFPQGNAHYGIRNFGSGTKIGGTTSAARNVIAGNGSGGISLEGPGGWVRGNYIGLLSSGNTPAGNDGYGIDVVGPNIEIGGASALAGNVISANASTGISVDDTATGTVIRANFIGTNATGNQAHGNGGYGIRNFAPGTIIEGDGEFTANLISGNAVDGIFLEHTGAGVTVAGNVIGLNWTRTGKLPNGGSGITVYSDANIIGAPGKINHISGNALGGIALGGFVFDNVVQHNWIGWASDPAARGNDYVGIRLYEAFDTLIGDPTGAAGNRIAYNDWYGVYVQAGWGNRILANSMHDNGYWGIDHEPFGVALNDPLDADFGPNQGQNFPVIAEASDNGFNELYANGIIETTPFTEVEIQIFASPSCDSGGTGEGKTFVTSKLLVTSDQGKAYFNVFGPGDPGSVLTATATTSAGTSEFSPCVSTEGLNPGSFVFSQTYFLGYENDPDGMATITVVRSGGSVGPATVEYSTTDDGAKAGVDYAATSGTLSFADQEIAKTFEIPVALDGEAESDEHVILTLFNPTGGATLGGASTSTLVILDDDPQYPTVYVSDGQLVEGDSGSALMSFTVTVTTGAQPVAMTLATVDGTATAGVDYQPVSGLALTFQPGDAPKTVTVPVLGDLDDEDPESFFLTLSSLKDATVTKNTGEGVILDDDGTPDPGPIPSCGDDVLDPGEECDDANDVDGDGCESDCTFTPSGAVCGNGVVETGEDCDPQTDTASDGCEDDCSFTPAGPSCGDGNVDPGEGCDDGNLVGGDGCESNCFATPAVPTAQCGDGTKDAGEVCDDGNQLSGDGCESTCVSTPPPAWLCNGGATITDAKLVLSRLGGAAGNEQIRLSGRLGFGPGAPANSTPLSSDSEGVQVQIADLGAGGAPFLSLTHMTSPISGASACGNDDGWTVTSKSTSYRYRNRSGALPAACAAGSAQGLRRLRLADYRGKKSGGISLRLLASETVIPAPTGALQVTVVLGGDAPAGAAGACASVVFPVSACTLGANGTNLVCE